MLDIQCRPDIVQHHTCNRVKVCVWRLCAGAQYIYIYLQMVCSPPPFPLLSDQNKKFRKIPFRSCTTLVHSSDIIYLSLIDSSLHPLGGEGEGRRASSLRSPCGLRSRPKSSVPARSCDSLSRFCASLGEGEGGRDPQLGPPTRRSAQTPQAKGGGEWSVRGVGCVAEQQSSSGSTAYTSDITRCRMACYCTVWQRSSRVLWCVVRGGMVECSA